MNNFYCYILLDPTKPGKYIYDYLTFDFEPFYVGKGKNNRINAHDNPKSTNTYKNRKIIKLKKIGLSPIKLKFIENIIEQDAFLNEIELISIIGRHDLNKGPLTNLTNGGEGSSGTVYDDLKKLEIGIRSKKQWEELKLNEDRYNKFKTNLVNGIRSFWDNKELSAKNRVIQKNTLQKNRELFKNKLKNDPNLQKEYTEKRSTLTKKHWDRIKKEDIQTYNEICKKIGDNTRKCKLGKTYEEIYKDNANKMKESRSKWAKENQDKFNCIRTGEDNPMFGKSLYSVWENKGGKDYADKRLNEWKEKKSGKTPWNKNNSIILQKDKDGNIVKEWNGLHEIQINLGFPKSNICKVLKKQRKSANGFIWEYLD